MTALPYVRKLQPVQAERWEPGVRPDIVFTDPRALVGKHWAHMGHQRELDGSRGIVLVAGEPVFIHRGEFIVTDERGLVSVIDAREFAENYEAAPAVPERTSLATLVDDDRAQRFPPESCRNPGDVALELVTSLVHVLEAERAAR